MKCPKCNSELTGDWYFCPDCGEKLETNSLFDIPEVKIEDTVNSLDYVSVDSIVEESKDEKREVRSNSIPEKSTIQDTKTEDSLFGSFVESNKTEEESFREPIFEEPKVEIKASSPIVEKEHVNPFLTIVCSILFFLSVLSLILMCIQLTNSEGAWMSEYLFVFSLVAGVWGILLFIVYSVTNKKKGIHFIEGILLSIIMGCIMCFEIFCWNMVQQENEYPKEPDMYIPSIKEDELIGITSVPMGDIENMAEFRDRFSLIKEETRLEFYSSSHNYFYTNPKDGIHVYIDAIDIRYSKETVEKNLNIVNTYAKETNQEVSVYVLNRSVENNIHIHTDKEDYYNLYDSSSSFVVHVQDGDIELGPNMDGDSYAIIKYLYYCYDNENYKNLETDPFHLFEI